MKSTKAIIFDFFGTLAEYENTVNVFDEMYNPLKGLLTEKEIVELDKLWWNTYNMYSKQAVKSCDEFSMYDVADEIIKILKYIPQKLLYEVVDIYMYYWIKKVCICKDTLDVIPRLSRKYMLGIISNTHYKSMVPGIINDVNIKQYFSSVVLSVEVKRRKPCKSIFYYAANLMGMKPEECCFIGDNYNEDILGAKNIGMLAIQICRENEGIKSLKDKLFISNLYELEEKLEGLT